MESKTLGKLYPNAIFNLVLALIHEKRRKKGMNEERVGRRGGEREAGRKEKRERKEGGKKGRKKAINFQKTSMRQSGQFEHGLGI